MDDVAESLGFSSNSYDSDDDLFEPRPPSPFPEDVQLQSRSPQSSNKINETSNSFFAHSSSATRPPVAGLKKLALNETDMSQETGAIPKKLVNKKYSGGLFPPLLKRGVDFRKDSSKLFSSTNEEDSLPSSAMNNKPNYFSSIVCSPVTVSSDSSNSVEDRESSTVPKPSSETSAVRTSSPSMPTQGPDSDRHSSGYGSDADDAANKRLAAELLSKIGEGRSDFVILSSDDEISDLVVHCDTSNPRVDNSDAELIDVGDSTVSSSSTLASRPGSSNNVPPRKFMKNTGSLKFLTRSNNSSGISGTKRKRPVSVRSFNNEIHDRRSNKRNSNNPGSSSYIPDSDSDVEFLSPLLRVSNETLATIHQLESDEAFARQLQSDEALALQLQAEFDAEATRHFNSHHRRRFFGGRNHRYFSNVERAVAEPTLTPPRSVYPSSRSPSLSPESESHRERYSRRWPPRYSRRNSDSPTLSAVLSISSLEDSLQNEPAAPQATVGRRSSLNNRRATQPVRPGRASRLRDDIEVFGGPNDRPPLLGHAGFVPPRVTPGHHRRAHQNYEYLQARDYFNDILSNASTWDFETLLDIADRLGEGTRGLETADIERFTMTKCYQSSVASGSSVEVKTEQESCSICMCEYVDGHEMRVLPCIHNFHKDCVDQWLKGNTTCPICRIDVRQ